MENVNPVACLPPTHAFTPASECCAARPPAISRALIEQLPNRSYPNTRLDALCTHSASRILPSMHVQSATPFQISPASFSYLRTRTSSLAPIPVFEFSLLLRSGSRPQSCRLSHGCPILPFWPLSRIPKSVNTQDSRPGRRPVARLTVAKPPKASGLVYYRYPTNVRCLKLATGAAPGPNIANIPNLECANVATSHVLPKLPPLSHRPLQPKSQ